MRRRILPVILVLLAAFGVVSLLGSLYRQTDLDLDTFMSRHDNMDELFACPFCRLSATYPPAPLHVPLNPDHERVRPNCHLILSTDQVMAFLDIMPITEGHVLIIPRRHKEKLGDLRGNEGAALGAWLPVISRATMKALGRDGGDWNVVQNNGASAAQVVPHVHYHIIPRGGRAFPEVKARSWTIFGKGQREELDDDEGVKLAAAIRREVQNELKSMESEDLEGFRLLSKL